MATFGSKSVNAVTNKLLAMIQESPYVVMGTQELDGSGAVDVPFEILCKIANKAVRKTPDTAFMLLAAGKTACVAVCYVPETCISTTASEWLTETGLTVCEFSPDPTFKCATFECEFTLKGKDFLNSQAFVFLRKRGLLQEDSDDGEFGFDF